MLPFFSGNWLLSFPFPFVVSDPDFGYPGRRMPYKSLRQCIDDLERHGHLVRIPDEVDPHLEMAEIQRRVYAAGGPAVLYERVRGCAFPAVSNLFGTMDRSRFLLRHTLERVAKIVKVKADPAVALRAPLTAMSLPWVALSSLPLRVSRSPVLARRARIDQLPRIRSWPDDGGAFITLPQVYTEDLDRPGVMGSNVGMYRIQMDGNDYRPNEQVGLHYQIHRGIGVHHAKALGRGERLRVSVFVGGPPAHTLAAVMPLPEGLSELVFAGMLAGRRFRYMRRDGHVLSADADFCITGSVDPARTLPEGPFGDHLGYYSLVHDFPVLDVEAVYHRPDAVWPFTVVGRPPQEDTSFGRLIHEITAPMVPKELPGVRALHAVDASGVHPLLLAIGSERYVPYGERVPRELLTIANAILGFGQCSLAKYLCVVAVEDCPGLDIHDNEAYFTHLLERVDWTRDLHFQTRTTIDTLDYSGTGLNAGSKLVIAAAGEVKRRLARRPPDGLALPERFGRCAPVLPGVLVIDAPPYGDRSIALAAIADLVGRLERHGAPEGFPLLVLVDDAEFSARDLRNFLWVTFTRSNPSHDVHGAHAFVEDKHWGCRGPLIIDARIKLHHAPPLIEDPAVTRGVDALAGRGGPLYGII